MCANILENAKEVFQSKIDQAKKVIRGKSPGQVLFFCCCFFQVQKLYFNIFNIWTPQALQVLKRSSSSTSNSPLIVKKSCVIKSGLGRPNTDLILVNKAGRPVRESFTREKNDFKCSQVRREGGKWEAGRLATDTLFILGSRANKALGFGQTRGRLYIKVQHSA